MKGMDRVKRGKGFRGLLNYLLRSTEGRKIGDKTLFKSGDGRIIGGNMLAADPRNLAREFAVTRRARPGIKKPVWHNALRLPQGEKISDEKWLKILNEYMHEMGFSEYHMRSYIMHDDDEGQHVHIIASRITPCSKLYTGENENLKSTRIIGKLEQKYGLVRTPQRKKGQNSGRKDRTEPTRNEAAAAARQGIKPHRVTIQDSIDELIANEIDAIDLILKLEKIGITAKPRVTKAGDMKGFSFNYGDVSFKASDLGQLYSWTRLQNQVIYNTDTHASLLRDYMSSGDTTPLKALKTEKERARIDAEIRANEARATQIREQLQEQQREIEQQQRDINRTREHKERDAKRIQATTSAATTIAKRVATDRAAARKLTEKSSIIERTYQAITERAKSIYISISTSLASLVTRAKQSAHRPAKPATGAAAAFAAHVEKMQQAEPPPLDLVALLDAHIKHQANRIDFNYYDNEPINFLRDLIDEAGLEQPTDADLGIHIDKHTDALNALVDRAEQALDIERPK